MSSRFADRPGISATWPLSSSRSLLASIARVYRPTIARQAHTVLLFYLSTCVYRSCVRRLPLTGDTSYLREENKARRTNRRRIREHLKQWQVSWKLLHRVYPLVAWTSYDVCSIVSIRSSASGQASPQYKALPMESLPHLRDVFPEHFSNNSSARPTPANNAPLAKGNTMPHPPNSNMRPTGHGPINHSNVANTAPRQGAHSGGASRATAPSFSVLHSGTLDVVSTSYSVPTNSSWAAMQRLPAEGSSAANVPMQGTNADRRRHVCPICSKPFERSSSLQTHMHIHTGERPYICPVEGCGREFNAKSNMLRHYRAHPQR